MAFNWDLTSPKKSIYEPTSEQLKLRDEEAKKKQANDPTWKKTGRAIIDTGVDALMGFLGLPQNESGASGVGELVNAGLPFAAYGPKGISRLFHGTPRLKQLEKFDTSLYNKGDVLGHMTHAAEQADYANVYADKLGTTTKANHLGNPINPGMIPLKPEAKNVLDLIDPNIDDLSQAVAQIKDPSTKASLISKFKSARRFPERAARDMSPNHMSQVDKDSFIKQPATHVLADNLRLKPGEIDAMPHDAIRYFDTTNKSWAFPESTPLKSQFGYPLNTAAEDKVSPIRMVRDDTVSSGNFPSIFQPPRNKAGRTWQEQVDFESNVKPWADYDKPKQAPPGMEDQYDPDSLDISMYDPKNKPAKKNMYTDPKTGNQVPYGWDDVGAGPNFAKVSDNSGYTTKKLDKSEWEFGKDLKKSASGISPSSDFEYGPSSLQIKNKGSNWQDKGTWDDDTYTKLTGQLETGHTYKQGDVFKVKSPEGGYTSIEIAEPIDITELNNLANKGYSIEPDLSSSGEDLSTKPMFKFETTNADYDSSGKFKPKAIKHPYVKPVYEYGTGEYLLQIGDKKFPQSKIGLALAKQELKFKLQNGSIAESEANNAFKELGKYKPKK